MKGLSTEQLELSPEAATHIVRTHLGALYCCPNPERIILCPGQLIGLINLLVALHCRSILLTDEEYYSADHFPGMRVLSCEPGKVAATAERARPDAVLMSLVSWRGRPLPVVREFQRLRTMSRTRPLLICDYAHAGAIGFPDFRGMTSDIVCGDLHKWVFPSKHMAQVAFLWPTTPKLQSAAKRVFRGYYLASSASAERSARWISPNDLVSAARWLKASNRTRRMLLDEFCNNFACAEEIAASLGLRPTFESCILWLPADVAKQKQRQLIGLEGRDDVEIWRTAKGWRILCSSTREREIVAS